MKMILIAVLVMFAQVSLASDFCDGFKEGVASIKGRNFRIRCPAEPFGQNGKTKFQQGIQAGVKAARK